MTEKEIKIKSLFKTSTGANAIFQDVVRDKASSCNNSDELNQIIKEIKESYELNPKAILDMFGRRVCNLIGLELTYSRTDVVKIIDELLQRPDFLLDAVQNETTNYDAETLLSLVEA